MSTHKINCSAEAISCESHHEKLPPHFLMQVTMADKEGAECACANPNPVIDGRRANVNLAYLGAKSKNHSQPGKERKPGSANRSQLW